MTSYAWSNTIATTAHTNTALFSQFTNAVRSFTGDVHAPALHMHSEGSLSVSYAPFEWVNPQAKLIIVGITPGELQAANALEEAKRQLSMGASDAAAIQAAKLTGAFSGPMRKNLLAMLDKVGLPKWLGVTSAAELFEKRADLIQTSSVIQYPTFVDSKKNYNGTPNLRRSPLLRSLVKDYFVPMAASLPEARILALGDVPWKTLQWLADEGLLDRDRVLGCIPHPSAANNERIGCFLETLESGATPSKKTNADKLLQMRQRLQASLECT
jgi:hypothetical protein